MHFVLGTSVNCKIIGGLTCISLHDTKASELYYRFRMAPTRQALEAQRTVISNSIQRMSGQAAAPESAEWTEDAIQMKATMLERLWVEYQAKQYEITSRADLNDADQDAAEEIAMQAVALYTAVKERLNVLLNARAPNRHRPIPKASEITLRKFNGDFTEWTAWRAQYVSGREIGSLAGCSRG